MEWVCEINKLQHMEEQIRNKENVRCKKSNAKNMAAMGRVSVLGKTYTIFMRGNVPPWGDVRFFFACDTFTHFDFIM